MNLRTSSPIPDELDHLLAEFFKTQLPQPWPNAPATASGPVAEPTARVASQNCLARSDCSSRSRLTLAASVALLLGTCWYLSNGFSPDEPNRDVPGPAPTESFLSNGSAAGSGILFNKIQKTNADKHEPAFDPGKVKIED